MKNKIIIIIINIVKRLYCTAQVYKQEKKEKKDKSKVEVQSEIVFQPRNKIKT